MIKGQKEPQKDENIVQEQWINKHPGFLGDVVGNAAILYSLQSFPMVRWVSSHN